MLNIYKKTFYIISLISLVNCQSNNSFEYQPIDQRTNENGFLSGEKGGFVLYKIDNKKDIANKPLKNKLSSNHNEWTVDNNKHKTLNKIDKKFKDNKQKSNASVFGSLLKKAYDGENIIEMAKIARFKHKVLSNKDYQKLVKISKGEIPANMQDIYDGEKFMIQRLGNKSKNLDTIASIIIAEASLKYKIQLDKFRENNSNKLPSLKEATNIAIEIIEQYENHSI